MTKIKLIFTGIVILLFIGLITTISILNNKLNNLQESYSISTANEKAFMIENSALKEENREFKFTVEQLTYFSDSLNDKINKVKEELAIKDENLKQLQYMLSVASKKDTIYFKDTLFIDPTLNKDTIIGNEWYNIEVGLKYPNEITTNPTFTSEKYVVISYKKETIKPPKKCWLGRLFQKKHKVVTVDVIEKNPYIENKQQRFIEIVK